MCTFCYFATLKCQYFRDKICYFLPHLWRHSWSKMHHLRHVRFDWHPFCISECIGPESFSAWNLTWHHQIYCFRAYVTLDLAAERCIACRLRALASVHWWKLQIAKMRQIMRREIPRNWRKTNNLQSNQLLPSGKMEGILCPRCETRSNLGL
jgi:hypothetical protein